MNCRLNENADNEKRNELGFDNIYNLKCVFL